jgi:hypothetical protein
LRDKKTDRKSKGSRNAEPQVDLSLDIVISENHHCSQNVRAFFKTVNHLHSFPLHFLRVRGSCAYNKNTSARIIFIKYDSGGVFSLSHFLGLLQFLGNLYRLFFNTNDRFLHHGKVYPNLSFIPVMEA